MSVFYAYNSHYLANIIIFHSCLVSDFYAILLVLGFILSLFLTIFIWFTDLYPNELYKVKVINNFKIGIPISKSKRIFRLPRDWQSKTVVCCTTRGGNHLFDRWCACTCSTIQTSTNSWPANTKNWKSKSSDPIVTGKCLCDYPKVHKCHTAHDV